MKYIELEVLKEYGSPTVYFCEHTMKHSCLIAIPKWNWSFLMDYAIDFEDEKPLLIEALKQNVFYADTENIANAFHDFVCSEFY
ncbi:hypothetical protein CN957_15865 [Bacillus cereus]|nr:hypothetical protein CN957_15865 [Bacillus cereus]